MNVSFDKLSLARKEDCFGEENECSPFDLVNGYKKEFESFMNSCDWKYDEILKTYLRSSVSGEYYVHQQERSVNDDMTTFTGKKQMNEPTMSLEYLNSTSNLSYLPRMFQTKVTMPNLMTMIPATHDEEMNGNVSADGDNEEDDDIPDLVESF